MVKRVFVWHFCILQLYEGLLTVFTELLSVLNLFSLNWVALMWLLIALILLFAITKGSTHNWKFMVLERVKQDRTNLILMFCMIVIVSIEAIIALVAAPNTIDSLTYHMSRF